MARATANPISELLDKVAETKRPVVLRRGNRNVAVVIPMAEYRQLKRLLRELEDREDAELALKRLSDPNETVMPYEQFRKELGLR